MPSGIGVSLQWRMSARSRPKPSSDNETLHGDFPLDPGLHIKAQNYFDLATTYTFGDHYNFRLGVNNILDNDPPLVTGEAPASAVPTSARPVRATAIPTRAPGMRSAATSTPA